MPKTYFIDVTNRDGVQTSRISLSKLQKTMLNYYLARLGIHQSEFGFPFIAHELNYIRANLELKALGALGDLVLSGWCRAIVSDVEAALPTGLRDLNLSISTSDQMIVHKFQGRRDREKIILEMVEAVTLAQKAGVTNIGVNAEDASRTDLDYLTDFALAAREAGARRLRYCDTLGYDSPMTIYQRGGELAHRIEMPLELQRHNDPGMAGGKPGAGGRG